LESVSDSAAVLYSHEFFFGKHEYPMVKRGGCMRVVRFLLFVSALLLPAVLFGQVQSNATQDPQAVSVLNQALSVAGGATAHRAVTDYTGSGTITYHGNPDVQGTVSIKALNSVAIRIDATLPTGVRSWAVHDGVATTKHENGARSVAANPPNAPSSDAFPYQTPLFPSSIAFPYRQLTNILVNPSFSVSYNGMTQVDGHSVHDIQVQRVSAGGIDPMSQYHVREFFIDTTTFQIVMTQDLVPKNTVHQIHYSNYTPVSGVLVPFAITEDLGGQSTWTIQLNQVSFNSGLQDSTFVLQ
jgi:hypothetical protein